MPRSPRLSLPCALESKEKSSVPSFLDAIFTKKALCLLVCRQVLHNGCSLEELMSLLAGTRSKFYVSAFQTFVNSALEVLHPVTGGGTTSKFLTLREL